VNELHVHLIVSGRVQGVGFRYSTQSVAIELGLTGWVRNQSDGTVEIQVEGKKEKIEQFIHQLEKGFHKFMRVDNVGVNSSSSMTGFKDFVIR
jgi:acylphosphatase